MDQETLAPLHHPQSPIENRIRFAGLDEEICICDTYEAAQRVPLAANQVLYCAMLRGRKIMYADGLPPQTFMPHESFVMAPGAMVEIDFPEASLDNPTRCITIEISSEKINEVLVMMNHEYPVNATDHESARKQKVLHTRHSSSTQRLLLRIARLFSENHADRDNLIDLSVTELLIRLLRKKERHFLLAHSLTEPDASSCSAALSWIRQNLAHPMDIDQLCKVTCMSRSRLYTEFRDKLGSSPAELQLQMRLREAARRLRYGEPITSVCLELGFRSPSHFSRRFKSSFGCTPSAYQLRHQKFV